MNNENNNKFKCVIDFISKHKTFIKKMIIFILGYFTIALVNSDPFTTLFNTLFGNEITTTLQLSSPLIMISSMEI